MIDIIKNLSKSIILCTFFSQREKKNGEKQWQCVERITQSSNGIPNNFSSMLFKSHINLWVYTLYFLERQFFGLSRFYSINRKWIYWKCNKTTQFCSQKHGHKKSRLSRETENKTHRKKNTRYLMAKTTTLTLNCFSRKTERKKKHSENFLAMGPSLVWGTPIQLKLREYSTA